MKHQAAKLAESPLAYIQTILSPWVLLGTSLLIVWFLARMTLLSWADLSYVLPMTSLGYVFTAFLGKYFFGEQITLQRWLGTLAIMVGMILVGLTTPNTTARAGEAGQ
jgi:drug/metabolite transporter (DMT)-like permease